MRSVEVLRATKDAASRMTPGFQTSKPSRVRPSSSSDAFVALSYRLSSIVVPREARNLLFPHFACRKKSEEARAFPGFLRIDVYRNRSTGNLPALTSSTSPETPPSRHAHRSSAEPQTFTELKLPPIFFPHPCAHYVRYVVIPSEARDRFFL